MKKIINLALSLIVAIGIAQASHAAIITTTLPEFNGGSISGNGNQQDSQGWYYDANYFANPSNPTPYFTVGTFNFTIPTGEQIISAIIYGQWGNSTCVSSAHSILNIDSVIIANSYDPQYNNPYNNDIDEGVPTPWSYIFSDYSVLNDGHAVFDVEQFSEFEVLLGSTTLQITTAPTPAPEPSTMLLGLMGLGSALGFRRKK